MDALFIGPVNGLQCSFDGFDADGALSGGLFAGAQMFRFVDLVVEAVEHESHQIGNGGFRALLLEEIHEIIVGSRRVFDQDLAHNTDAGLALLTDRDRVKVPDHLNGQALDLGQIQTVCLSQKVCADLHPLHMLGFDHALFQLIGAHAVDAAHHDIAKDNGIGGTGDQLQVELESGIFLEAGHVDRDDRDLSHACLCQGAADKADVIGRTAAAAGLGHQNSCPVKIVFAGIKSFHDLAHDEEGRIAGVIVDIFEAEVDSPAVIVGQDDQVVAAGIDRRFEQVKMDR